MEKEGETGQGCDVSWNKHSPAGIDDGHGQNSCASSVADGKEADRATSVVATADAGANSTLTPNVGGDLEPGTAPPAGCERVGPRCAGGVRVGLTTTVTCQLLFAGKWRTNPQATEGPKAAQAEKCCLPVAAEMWLSLSVAVTLQKDKTVTSQRRRDQDLLVEHNLQMRDGFCRESPRLPPARAEPERSWQPERRWQPPGLTTFPPGCQYHPCPPNSPSPMHYPGPGWHRTGVSTQP